jgi:two-component system cell cycle sensor histidine kinase/response regulator CckA
MEPILNNPDKNRDRIIHILIVDDEKNIVVINKMVLEQMGYIVQSAYNGREAMTLIKENRDVIDVIVTDYLMPGMNGIELAIEAEKYLPETPIILYTGKGELFDEKQITDAGITRVVIKPLKMKDLDIIIRDILSTGEEVKPVM